MGQTDEYKAVALGANESDAAKLQKIKERNDEYNQFLASKNGQNQNRRPGQQGAGVTLPGLRYSTSAQENKKREMEEERNKEYNELLRTKQRRAPPAAPKQGWGTPTYEEMLDKKRAQESQYRRANDLLDQPDFSTKEPF